jgi:hypothetical protein
VKCGKRVVLRGGFTYTVREARDNYTCFFCGGVIPRRALYVEERFSTVTRRYHYECVSRVVPRIKAIEALSGVVLCTDDMT